MKTSVLATECVSLSSAHSSLNLPALSHDSFLSLRRRRSQLPPLKHAHLHRSSPTVPRPRSIRISLSHMQKLKGYTGLRSDAKLVDALRSIERGGGRRRKSHTQRRRYPGHTRHGYRRPILHRSSLERPNASLIHTHLSLSLRCQA